MNTTPSRTGYAARLITPDPIGWPAELVASAREINWLRFVSQPATKHRSARRAYSLGWQADASVFASRETLQRNLDRVADRLPAGGRIEIVEVAR